MKYVNILLLLSIFVFGSSSPPNAEILFVDSFEVGNLQDRWHLGNMHAVKINYNPRNVRSGIRSLEVTALPGKGAGEMIRIWFMPGYDTVHVRWFCKFDDHFDQGNLMHLSKLIAGKDRWSGYGTAGMRPTGFDFFRTSLDPWRDWGENPPPGEPILYSYFPSMKVDPETGKYWGNIFRPENNVLITPGRWYCMEVMLKANLAGLRNGEQAFWINGKLIGYFKNIPWRYTNDLKINSFSLGLYIHNNEKVNRVWFDDVIVSTSYIGLF